MKSCITGIALFLSLIVSTSFLCSCGKDNESMLRETVDSFSTAYFNWQFSKALNYVDEPSRRWLRYAASQVNQEDVDSLRAMEEGAKVAITGIRLNDTDSTAAVTVNVSKFLSLDSIGKSPHILNDATFHLKAACRNGQWKVVLSGLPKQ